MSQGNNLTSPIDQLQALTNAFKLLPSQLLKADAIILALNKELAVTVTSQGQATMPCLTMLDNVISQLT